MNNHVFSARSAGNLAGVHPHLVAVMAMALAESDLDFAVTEGLRTKERQAELVNKGASQTMNSRHLTGHAVDVAVLVDGQVRWDWPLYERLSATVQAAADRLAIPIVWGGSWTTLRDGPHYELDRDHYPADGSAPPAQPQCKCCGQTLEA